MKDIEKDMGKMLQHPFTEVNQLAIIIWETKSVKTNRQELEDKIVEQAAMIGNIKQVVKYILPDNSVAIRSM